MAEPQWVTVYAICDECKLSAERDEAGRPARGSARAISIDIVSNVK